MKRVKTLSTIDKERIYDLYSRLIESFEDYEEIEKEEMLIEIKNIYKDYNNIISLCNLKEIECLKSILKKKKNEFDESIIPILQDKLLIYNEKEQIKITDEFAHSIKKAIRKVSQKEKQLIDEVNNYLIGACKIYGIVSPEKLCEILMKKTDLQKEEILKFIKTDKRFKYYTYEVLFDEEEYLVYEPFHYFEEELVYTLESYPDLEYSDISLEDMKIHEEQLFDTRKESIREFFEFLHKVKFKNMSELIAKLIEFSVLDYKREELMEYLLSQKELKKIAKEELSYLLDNAMNDMPSAVLKGHTPNELRELLLQKEYDQNYQKTWDKTKESEQIQDYKSLREETDILIGDCIGYLINNYPERIAELTKITKQNKIIYKAEDGNELNNLILFHTIKEKEEILFSKYMKEDMNVLSSKYKIAWQIEETVTESLFQIKKLDSNKGIVKLRDTITNKNYDIVDIALSSGSKNLEGSYLYTTIVTVNKISFANGYAFIFLKEQHDDIEKDIKKMKETVIGVENEQTKTFFACHKLFEKENIVFTSRTLE